VERFLSGHRDLVTRQTLSRTHLVEAHALFEKGERTRALEEVGRALALDPTNGDAFETVVRLLSDPPKKLPLEVKVELERADDRQRRLGLKRAIGVYALPPLLFFVPAWL